MHTSRSYNLSKLNKYKKKKSNAKNVKKYNFYDKKAKYYSHVLYGGAEETMYNVNNIDSESFIDNAFAYYEQLNEDQKTNIDTQLAGIVNGKFSESTEFYQDKPLKDYTDNERSQIVLAVTLFLTNVMSDLAKELKNSLNSNDVVRDENIFKDRLKTYEENIINLINSVRESINLDAASEEFNNSIAALEQKIENIKPANINTDEMTADLILTYNKIIVELLDLVKDRKNAGQKIEIIKSKFTEISDQVENKITDIKQLTSTNFASQYEAMLYVSNYVIGVINDRNKVMQDFNEEKLKQITTESLKQVLADVYNNKEKYLESLTNQDNLEKLEEFFNKLGAVVENIETNTTSNTETNDESEQ